MARAAMGSWTRRRARGPALLAAALLVLPGCGDGCGCEPPPPDGGPAPERTLTLLSPLSGAVLTPLDDRDAAAAGLQIDVRAQLSPGGPVTLVLVVDDAEVAAEEVSGERHTFANVSLAADAAGIAHEICVRADGYEGDCVDVTARLPPPEPAECAFLTPGEGAIHALSTTVIVDCERAPSGASLTLEVIDAGGDVDATLTGTLNVNGTVQATVVVDEAGSYTLRAFLTADPGVVVEKQLTFLPPVAAACTITAPTAGAPPSTSPAFDVVVECAAAAAGATVECDLEGPSAVVTGPFAGSLAAAGNGVQSAIIPVSAAEPGATEIRCQIANDDGSRDDETVLVPAFPVCDAEIREPAEAAALDLDVDLETAGNQIVVRVGAADDPGHCRFAEASVSIDGVVQAAGVPLGGNAGQSGAVAVVVTVPNGASAIGAALTLPATGVTGASDSVGVTFVPAAVGARLVGIPDCGGFGDGCFNLSAASDDGSAFVRDLVVQAAAQGGACPFTDPLLDVEGLGQELRADGDTTAAQGEAWVVDGALCTTTFSDVTLHGDLAPDDVVRVLVLSVARLFGGAETRDFALGLDRVAPTLAWLTADGARFGAPDDEVPSTAVIDAALLAAVTGMSGRAVVVVETGAPSAALDSCVLAGAAAAACDLVVTLVDGAYTMVASGADAAGNLLVAPSLDVVLDGTAPCVAAIAVAADADGDGDITFAEGGAAPVSTSVTVTFGSGGCAIDDGKSATLLSDVAGARATASTLDNALTFTGVSLSEAAHVLSVAVSDAAGNPVLDDANNQRGVLVDVTAPSCAVTDPTAALLVALDDEDGDPSDGLEADITVATDGASAALLVDGVERDAGAASGGLVVFDDVTLAEGERAVAASCLDEAGNARAADAYEVLVDSVAPALAFVTPPATLDGDDDVDAERIGLQTSLTVSAAFLEAGLTVSVYRADGQGAPTGAALGSAVSTVDTSDGTPANVVVPISLLSCPSCAFVATASDVHGNAGRSAAVTIDVVAALYVCEVTNPDGGGDPLVLAEAFDVGADGDADVAFAFSCPGLPASSTASLFVDDFTTPVETKASAGATVVFAVVELAEGTGQVQLLVDDGAGNVGGTDRRDYYVDVTAPALAFDTLADPVRLTFNAPAAADRGPLDVAATAGYQASLDVTVQGCAGGSVVVTADGAPVTAGAPPLVPDASEVVSVSVDIPDGAGVELAASCTDDVGNVGSTAVTAEIDTLAPAAPTDLTAALAAAPGAARTGAVDVGFTMPGDDGTAGTATTVELIAAQEAVTAASFDAPTLEQRTSFTVTPTTTLPITTGASGQPSLAFGPHTWTFALRVADDVGNLADAVPDTAAIDLPTATVSFDLLVRTIDNVDDDVPPGDVVDDRFGAVASTAAGDLNNDGYDDLVWSAWGEGSGCAGAVCNGAIYVVYGQASSVALTSAAPQRIEGPASSSTGVELAVVPSIDGEDAIADLLVAATDATGARRVRVFYGVDGGQLAATHDYEVTDTGSSGFGLGVYGLGDIDGDGVGDWAAADDSLALPPVYVFFGDATKRTPADSAARADVVDVVMTAYEKEAGGPVVAVRGIGDVDGDGIDDIAIGQSYISATVTDAARGRVFIVKGRPTTNWAPAYDVTAGAAQTLVGGESFRLGQAITVGDVDGANGDDLVVGATGRAVVYYDDGAGTFALGPTFESGAALLGSRVGLAVGDMNGDGRDDICLGAEEGLAVFLSLGQGALTVDVPSASYAFGSGTYLVGAPGDLDNDGLADVAVGSSELERVHILYGP